MKPIINVADAPTQGMANPPHFEFSMAQLAGPLGAKAIGANLTRLPPGKAAFPFHHHYGNEEHFFVLSGTGVLRFGSDTYPVKAHDYIVAPPGGPETAHQLINSGGEDLVYLAISTKIAPEVAGYPDSDKTGVMAAPWGQEPHPFVVHDETRPAVGYWDGEDGAQVAEALAAAKAG